MQKPSCLTFSWPFLQFYTNPQKPLQTEQTCPPHPVSWHNHTLAAKLQTIFNQKSLLVTGLDSAHLAQRHSAAGENEAVSQNWQLAQFNNCPLLTKDWIICRSCVTCRIHMRPINSPYSFIHCLLHFSLLFTTWSVLSWWNKTGASPGSRVWSGLIPPGSCPDQVIIGLVSPPWVRISK